MDKKERQAIDRHVAGASIVHKGPFDDLTTPVNQENLDKGFIDEFMVPFYMNIGRLNLFPKLLLGKTKGSSCS